VIIDGHVHVWPDKIAERALGQPKEGLARFGNGTVADAGRVLAAAGIDRGICLGVADRPERLEAANRFVGSLDPERFIGFGSIHPARSPEENVAILREHGLKGVKVHPLFQAYALDDPGLWSVFEALAGEFVAVVHVGEGDTPEAGLRCTPRMIRDIARNFPKLDLVACHLGGYEVLDQAEELVVGLPGNVYLDTSWPPGIGSLDPDRVRRVIERHGPDRVVFATDWPMADPAAEVGAIRALGLTDADTDAVLGGNYARLLGLP
jgi:hypothetical protein